MLCAVIFLLLTASLLLWPQAASQSIASCLVYCLGTLVPSLFPFMVLAGFAVESPAAEFLSRPLGFISRYLFRLPGCCAAPVLMSFIGGYPAGAKGASLLLEKGRITERQAGRMLMFCVNPGLAFTVTYLGVGVFGSAGLGWRLFLSVTLSAVLLGAVTGLSSPIPKEGQKDGERSGGTGRGSLVRSVAGASRSVLVMCAFIALFAGLSAILHQSGLFQGAVRLLSRLPVFTPAQWASVVSFLLEVTGGTGDARALGAGPGFFAFGLAFGGACVHLQVLSMFKEPPVKLPVFIACRFAHGLLSAGIFGLMDILSPVAGSGGTGTQAAAGVYTASGTAGGAGFLGGASLLMMCAAFLLIVGSRGEEGEKLPLANPGWLGYTIR